MGDGGVFGPKRDEANSQPHFIVLVLVPAAIESNVGSYTYENTGEKYTNPRRQVCVDTIGYEPKDRVGRLTMTSGTTRCPHAPPSFAPPGRVGVARLLPWLHMYSATRQLTQVIIPRSSRTPRLSPAAILDRYNVTTK